MHIPSPRWLWFSATLLVLTSAIAAQKSETANPGQSNDHQTTAPKSNGEEGIAQTRPTYSPGAVPSSSDSETPEPESGTVLKNVYTNKYFGLSYPLPPHMTEGYKGPPPSATGYYVLSQLRPAAKGEIRATAMVAARDLFFFPRPSSNAMELLNDMSHTLNPVYKATAPPTIVKIANHSFARFEYEAHESALSWRVLATEIRCHAVQFVFTSPDPKLLDSMIADMNNMKLPPEADATAGTGGGEFPVCVKGYADQEENILHKVEPRFAPPGFVDIPVRIIIDVKGRVKHIHVISAYPEQATNIKEALAQWAFKPYMQNGRPIEIETGLLFEFPAKENGTSQKKAKSVN